MNNKIKEMLDKIQDLEAGLETEIEEQRRIFHYTIEEKRVRFETVIQQRHHELRTGVLRFIRESGFVNVLFSPVIYFQIIPLLLLDLAVSLYQFTVFPVYGITKVPRDDFIAIDRHQLSYLNGIERLNCAFCGYANGLLAYSREIAGRSEEYWCPIKHARRTKGQHRRYFTFSEFGDAEGFHNLKQRQQHSGRANKTP